MELLDESAKEVPELEKILRQVVQVPGLHILIERLDHKFGEGGNGDGGDGSDGSSDGGSDDGL